MSFARTLQTLPLRLARRDPAAGPGVLARDRAAAEDATLLAWAAEGDRPAFDALAGRHLARLHRLALRLLGEAAEAEDVVQEAMLRAWQHAAGFDPARAAVGTWLHRILVNLAIDRLRRRPAIAPGAVPETADGAAGPEEALQAGQEQALLRAALATLPERQRAAIVLAYDREMTGAEAAAALGISARGLEGLLHRARKALAARLGDGA
jgi:RNA polymerase sigma-70 factor (ECF subfamily)